MNSKRSFRFVLFTVLVFTGSQAWSAIYYVDSAGGNDGNVGTSPGSAWQTLAKVNSVTFSPGDWILFIRGGIWSGQLAPAGSGSSGSPIVMDAYGSILLPRPLIEGNGSAYATILLENQPYWELRNLEVTNTGATDADRVGIYIGAEDYGQLDHIHLVNLVVHDVNGLSGVPNNANGGIYFNITGSTTPTWFGSWVSLSSDGVGDYVQFITGNIPAGVYDLKLVYKGYFSRGTLQASVDGVDVGDELDQYESATTYQTIRLGSVAFDAAGTHTLRLRVTGKQDSSSGYTLSADAFILTPQ